jgi:outer membrane murein-binding lipoprotein Lpp
MIERMWEILTTFTDESQKAVLDQCAQKGFDPNRGIVSLDESFINLNSAKYILTDAIEKRKLVQLPITVQKALLSQLEAISRSLTNLVNGTDEVENLVNYVEQLNTAIWQYGLHNLSDELLGYRDKMNQLKSQEVEIVNLRREIEKALDSKKTLEELLNQASTSADSLKSFMAISEEHAKKTSENLTATTQTNLNSGAILATIQQNETVVTQLLSSVKTSSAEVLALETRIKEFYSQIDQYRSKIEFATSDAQAAVKTNKEATDELIKNLRELEDQIKDQIRKATGFSLFHSFQTRQFELAKAKQFWVYALMVLVATSLGVSIYAMSSTSVFDVAFYLKLSMSLPLIYAIWYCTVQHGRERKLEEEYTFKSNISISLVPYKELVEKLVNDQQTGEREKFTAFIIDAITKVYTSPTDRIFDTEQSPKGSSVDVLKQLEKALKAVIDPLEPLIKVLKH